MHHTKNTTVNPSHTSFTSTILENIRFLLIIFAIVIPVRMFIAQPFLVRGDSMLPTFVNKDYLIVDEISYRFKNPGRGDVVVFRMPDAKEKRYLIKRIIGLPGETLIFNGSSISVKNTDHPKEFTLTEPYITPGSFSTGSEITLDDQSYFVMGDNRPNSYDSRSWGALDKEYLVGRVILRMYHFDTLGIFPGFHNPEPIAPIDTKTQ